MVIEVRDIADVIVTDTADSTAMTMMTTMVIEVRDIADVVATDTADSIVTMTMTMIKVRDIADAMVTDAVDTPEEMTMIEAGDAVEEEDDGDNKNQEIDDRVVL